MPFRADGRGRAAGGVQGVRQARDRRGGSADRALGGRRAPEEGIVGRSPAALSGREASSQGRRPRRGQGRHVVDTREAARAALREVFLDGRFGDREVSVVVEEHLRRGALAARAVRRRARVPMAPARDYKRIFDGDGAPTPAAWAPTRRCPGSTTPRRRLVAPVHQPIVELMRARGTPFHGVLYGGLMLTPAGPQCDRVQRSLRRPRDAGAAPAAALGPARPAARAPVPGGLEGERFEWSPDWAVTIVLASAGYPESSSRATRSRSRRSPGRGRGHACRHRAPRAGIVTAGGRVLNVTALGADPARRVRPRMLRPT